MIDSPVIRHIARFMVPFIQLYGVYVFAHGEVGPGGGFQAGVIIAASFVLIGLVYGWNAGREAIPEWLSDHLTPSGALLYGGIGFAAMVAGGAFLEYAAFVDQTHPHAVHTAHHLGLVGIELGVTITVTAAMITLFFEIARVDDWNADGLPDLLLTPQQPSKLLAAPEDSLPEMHQEVQDD